MGPVLGLDSPSPYDEPKCLQVAVVGGPQGRRHPILVRRIQLLPCGLLQHGQVAVPGRPVVPVVHGGAPSDSLRVRFHWGFWRGLLFPQNSAAFRPGGEGCRNGSAAWSGTELTGWLPGDGQ